MPRCLGADGLPAHVSQHDDVDGEWAGTEEWLPVMVMTGLVLGALDGRAGVGPAAVVGGDPAACFARHAGTSHGSLLGGEERLELGQLGAKRLDLGVVALG